MMYKWMSFLCCTLLLASCRKEISLELETETKLVIDARISNVPNFQTEVRISKTRGVFSNNDYQDLKPAHVLMGNDRGEVILFYRSGEGVYLPDETYFPTEGATYWLRIEYDHKIYTATSFMPYRVNLDSVSVISVPFSLSTGSDKNYAFIPRFNDPAGVKNFYRFRFDTDRVGDSNFLLNDFQADGKMNEKLIINRMDIMAGDWMDVQMDCIDEQAYKYYYQLEQNRTVGQAGGPVPANPPTNIRGGALGYFLAFSVSQNKVMIR